MSSQGFLCRVRYVVFSGEAGAWRGAILPATPYGSVVHAGQAGKWRGAMLPATPYGYVVHAGFAIGNQSPHRPPRCAMKCDRMCSLLGDKPPIIGIFSSVSFFVTV